MFPMNNTTVYQWVVFGLSLAAGIGSLLAQFLGTGNYTPEAITLFVVAVLMLVLTQITKSEANKVAAQLKALKK
jgi:ABC-type anion transport system duplicated permease subunit